MRLVLWYVVSSCPTSLLPRGPTHYGDDREVEGVNSEKAEAHVFSVIASIVWHPEIALKRLLRGQQRYRVRVFGTLSQNDPTSLDSCNWSEHLHRIL